MDNNETVTPELTSIQQTTQTLQLIAAGTGAVMGLISLGMFASELVGNARDARRAKKAAQTTED